jgi:hypothetical protein
MKGKFRSKRFSLVPERTLAKAALSIRFEPSQSANWNLEDESLTGILTLPTRLGESLWMNFTAGVSQKTCRPDCRVHQELRSRVEHEGNNFPPCMAERDVHMNKFEVL